MIVPEGQLPWHVGAEDDTTVFDERNNLIGEMDTASMAQFVVDCVNYVWEAEKTEE